MVIRTPTPAPNRGFPTATPTIRAPYNRTPQPWWWDEFSGIDSEASARASSRKSNEERLTQQYLAILAQYGGSAYVKPTAAPAVPVHEPRLNAANTAEANMTGAKTTGVNTSSDFVKIAGVIHAANALKAGSAANAAPKPADIALASAVEVMKAITGQFIPQNSASGPKLSAGQRLYLERWPVPASEVQVLSAKTAYSVKADGLIVFDDCDEAASAAARLQQNSTVRIEIIAGPRGMYVDAKGNERWAPMSGLSKK